MRREVIIDSGPLVAFLNARDRHHDWVVAQWSSIAPPLLTCEAVVSEACFLVRGLYNGISAIFELLNRSILSIPFSLADHLGPVSSLLRKYANVPMSPADACLVRMSELYKESTILTFDNDFNIYRRHKRQTIPVLNAFDS